MTPRRRTRRRPHRRRPRPPPRRSRRPCRLLSRLSTTVPAEGVDEATPTPTATDAASDAVKDKKAKDAADVGVLTVPDPGPDTAVITVKVGSDRTGITGVTHPRRRRAGAQHRQRRPRAARVPTVSPAPAPAGPSAPPTPRATARSPFPDTQARPAPAGVNRDARFWVVQASVPAGYYANPEPSHGRRRRAPASSRRTPSAPARQLRANNTYSSQDANDFMLSSGADASRPRVASGSSRWQPCVRPPHVVLTWR